MEFGILGPLEVRHQGQPLPLAGEKQKALLSVLLLNANRVVSTDRLLDELWGEGPPKSGSRAVGVLVWKLRRAFGRAGGPNPIVTRPPGYVIELDPEQLDLLRFERLFEDAQSAFDHGDPAATADVLRGALALWRGSPLADFVYEDFAQATIVRLEELRLAAIELRTEAELALGHHRELVGELETLVGEHPHRERLRGQLMLALYRSGRQAEALEAYQDARRALVEGLGIEPSPALQALERAILRQDIVLDLPEEAPGHVQSLPAPERSILVFVQNGEAVEPLLALAGVLASRPPREIILAQLVPGERELAEASAHLQERRAALLGQGQSVRAVAFISPEPSADLVRLVSDQDVDLLLLNAPGRLLDDGVLKGRVGPVLADAPCDVALLVSRNGGAYASTSAGAVLIPFGGVEHDWAAVELGAWIVGARGGWLKLVGTAADRGRGRRDASRLLGYASLAIQRAFGISAEPLLVPPGANGIVEATRDADLLVLGLSSRWRHEGLGGTRLSATRSAQSPTLLVRRGLRPGGLAPKESLTRFTWTIAGPGQ